MTNVNDDSFKSAKLNCDDHLITFSGRKADLYCIAEDIVSYVEKNAEIWFDSGIDFTEDSKSFVVLADKEELKVVITCDTVELFGDEEAIRGFGKRIMAYLQEANFNKPLIIPIPLAEIYDREFVATDKQIDFIFRVTEEER